MELDEKLFCSSACLSQHRDKIGEAAYNKQSKATFEKKRDLGWIPERAIMYIDMCRRCNKKLRDNCKAGQYVSGMHRDTLRKTETVPWCCHARFNLSSALSDGTVALGAAQKIQAKAEELVKDKEIVDEVVGPPELRRKIKAKETLSGVTTTILDLAAAETATRLDLPSMEDKTPKETGEIMIHYAACLECDPVFGAECEEQAVEKELNNTVEKVRPLTRALWCEHTLHALSALMLNKNMTVEKLQAIINSAEDVAERRGDPGLHTRHLFIALGRAVE
jgi:ribosomal protein L30E